MENKNLFLKNSFPLSVSLSRVRAILKILNETKGLSLRELASYTKEHIDLLFPLISAAGIMELLTIKEEKVIITKKGSAFLNNPDKNLSSILKKIEPAKTVLILLKNQSMTTPELAVSLKNRKLISGDTLKMTEELHNFLITWCLKANIVSYTPKNDLWSIAV